MAKAGFLLPKVLLLPVVTRRFVLAGQHPGAEEELGLGWRLPFLDRPVDLLDRPADPLVAGRSQPPPPAFVLIVRILGIPSRKVDIRLGSGHICQSRDVFAPVGQVVRVSNLSQGFLDDAPGLFVQPLVAQDGCELSVEPFQLVQAICLGLHGLLVIFFVSVLFMVGVSTETVIVIEIIIANSHAEPPLSCRGTTSLRTIAGRKRQLIILQNLAFVKDLTINDR